MALLLEPQHWIAIYAAAVATGVAVWNIWKEWSDRRAKRVERKRLRIELEFAVVKNRPDGRDFLLCPLVVSNLGRESVILQAVVARGKNSVFWPGDHSEPGAAYGIRERVLPCKLETGQTVELPLLTASAFSEDLFEVAVIDNDGHEFKLGESHIRAARAKIARWRDRSEAAV